MPLIRATELEQILDGAESGAEQLGGYLRPDRHRSKLMQPAVWVDEARVEFPPETESRLIFGLDAQSLSKRARARRQLDFVRRVDGRPHQIKLLAEGDCWFQFPPVLRDIVENLSRDYPVFDISEASTQLPGRPERIDRLEALIRDKEIDGLLLSGGARELFGGGDPVLGPVNGMYCKAVQEVAGDLDQIVTRLTKSFPSLKIFVHGYDRFIPVAGGAFGSPLSTTLQGQGVPMAEARAIVGGIVDQFNDAIQEVAARFNDNVCIVDCRNVVGDERWYDELYPNDAAFGDLAAKFKASIEMELRPRYPNGGPAVYSHAGSPVQIPGSARGGRLALSIGIGAYRYLRRLENPRRDAAVMRGKLNALGYSVQECLDAGSDELHAAIVMFLDALEAASNSGSKPTAVLFYAGHGIQVNGENFLIPSDANIRSQSDLSAFFKLQDLIAKISRLADTTLVFLDSCRDDPLPPGPQSSGFSAPRGLAVFRKVEGAFVAYATHPDAIAWDGVPGQENSPFTLALSQFIDQPYDSIFEMMIEVTNKVRELTRDEQVPWQQIGLRKSFSFIDAGGEERPLDEGAINRLEQEQEDALWRLVQSTGSVELAQSFVAQYPASTRKVAAQRRIEELLRRRFIRSTINRGARAIAVTVLLMLLLASGRYLRFETVRHEGEAVGVDLIGGDLDLPVPVLLQPEQNSMTESWCRWSCVLNYFRGCVAYNFGGTNCYLKREVLYYDVENEPNGVSGYLRPFFKPAVEKFPYHYVPGKYLNGRPIETVSDASFGTSKRHRELDIPGFKVSFARCQAKFLELAKAGQAEGFTHDALDNRCYLLKAVNDFYRDRECHPFPASATISATVIKLDERHARHKCVDEKLRMHELLRRHGMVDPAPPPPSP